MKSKLTLSLILLSGLAGFRAHAQFQGEVYKEDSLVKVIAWGQQQSLAWSGGLNVPQFALADLNNDGRKDLVIFERGTEQIRTFINIGIQSNPHYIYKPEYAKTFPQVSNYLKMVDYNKDGISDLVHRGSGLDSNNMMPGNSGFQVFRGYYNSQNQLSFRYFKNLYVQYPNGWVNAFVNNGTDLPDIVDVDDDGDLDFMAFSGNGSFINWYRNCQVEDNLPADSLRICLASGCWGKVTQGFPRTHILNASCVGTEPTTCKMTLHTGNTVCMVDIDGDKDFDMLNGNVSFSDLTLLVNGRMQFGGIDSIMAQDTLWQSNGKMAYMPQFAAAFWLDIDQDGDKDILVAPNAPNASENYKVVSFYKNTGTDAAPSFVWQSDTMLVDRMIDVGTASYPLFYDYNKDGKPDLFVGSEGYFTPNGTLVSRISYYQNTSTAGNPSLTLQTKDFLGIGAQNFQGAALAIGDLDNDGKDDLVLGHTDGTLSFYKNQAASGSVQPVWQFSHSQMKDQTNTTIDVDQYAAPLIYDMDKDGKKDLVIGSNLGYLQLFLNKGGNNQLSLQFKTNQLGGVRVDPTSFNFDNNSTPFIGRIDNTPNEYLMVGSGSGVIYRYTGFQSGNVNQVFQLMDTMYSNIRVGYRSAPAVADVDANGKYDMVIGNLLGGLNLYRQDKNVHVAGNYSFETECSVYPNPATDAVQLSWNPVFATTGQLYATVYSLTGQVLISTSLPASAGRGSLDIRSLPAGMYLVVMQAGVNRYVSRITTLRP